MQVGVVYPQTELEPDPSVIRDYAQTIEALGYQHVLAYDHVLGANPNRPGNQLGPYTNDDSFMEPFSLFSFIAGVVEKLGFITGIIILPQRQTALVAKQAATLDRLCEGRFRLGIGVGWNPVEYIALNQDFTTRGARSEEQVQLMRQLWTEPLVTYKGRWHDIPDAGINPLPLQQPIPIWFGGHADIVLQRMARLGDGWLPGHASAQDAQPALDTLGRYLEAQGRQFSEFGIEPRPKLAGGSIKDLLSVADGWKQAGASHISVNTMGCGFSGLDGHLQALEDFAAGFIDG